MTPEQKIHQPNTKTVKTMDKQLLEQEAEAMYKKLALSGTIARNGNKIADIQRAAYIAGATSSTTVKELEREVERLKKDMLELNAVNSGLRYAATELQFRVDKQNEHISILQDQLKEADKIAAANNKKCQNIDNK